VHGGDGAGVEQARGRVLHEQREDGLGGVLEARAGEVGDERPAEGRELAGVVQQEGREVVVTRHVLAQVVPVVLAHGDEALALRPLGGRHARLLVGDLRGFLGLGRFLWIGFERHLFSIQPLIC